MEWYTFFQSLNQREPKSIGLSVLLERLRLGSPGDFFSLWKLTSVCLDVNSAKLCVFCIGKSILTARDLFC